jgi:hypothetical protein
VRGKGWDPTTAASSFEGCSGLAKALAVAGFAALAAAFGAAFAGVAPLAGAGFLVELVIPSTFHDYQRGIFNAKSSASR